MAQRGPSAGPADLRRPKSAKGVVIDGCVVTESKPSGLVKEACFGALCRIDVAAFRGPVSCRTKPQCKDVLGVVGPLHAGTFVDGFSRLHAPWAHKVVPASDAAGEDRRLRCGT